MYTHRSLNIFKYDDVCNYIILETTQIGVQLSNINKECLNIDNFLASRCG